MSEIPKFRSQTVVIEYLPNYKVKYSIRIREVTESEGGGWYSVVGKEIVCYASRIKHEAVQMPKNPVTPENLTEENKKVFEIRRKTFEAGDEHKQWMKQFSEKINE